MAIGKKAGATGGGVGVRNKAAEEFLKSGVPQGLAIGATYQGVLSKVELLEPDPTNEDEVGKAFVKVRLGVTPTASVANAPASHTPKVLSGLTQSKTFGIITDKGTPNTRGQRECAEVIHNLGLQGSGVMDCLSKAVAKKTTVWFDFTQRSFKGGDGREVMFEEMTNIRVPEGKASKAAVEEVETSSGGGDGEGGDLPSWEDLVGASKEELKEFCKENDLKLPKGQPTQEFLARHIAKLLEIEVPEGEPEEAEEGDEEPAEEGGEGGEITEEAINAMGKKELVALIKEYEIDTGIKNLSFAGEDKLRAAIIAVLSAE